MNRAQSRKLIKTAKNRGIDKTVAEFFIKAQRANNLPQELQEGDRVRLNVAAIREHPDYCRLNEKYHEFIDGHENDIFTVTYDKRRDDKSVVCLAEDSNGWLFWTGNLIKVADTSEGVE